MKTKWCIILIFSSISLYAQKFAVVDNDTYEIIQSVDFILYSNDTIVYKGITENNKATILPSDIEYDKIEFVKEDYYTIFIDKKNMNGMVFLSKKIVHLDEVLVISKKNDEIFFGETNRIVNSESRPLLTGINFGSIFYNEKKDLLINKTAFYVDKVKYKTAYKIHYIEVEESIPFDNLQTIELKNNVYTTDTLYLHPKQKNRIEVNHKEKIEFKRNTTILVCVELLNYYDIYNNIITPKNNERTKLKLQLSNVNNYYAKMINSETKNMTKKMININRMIKYDFVNELFTKPHKSNLLSPSILLTTRVNN